MRYVCAGTRSDINIYGFMKDQLRVVGEAVKQVDDDYKVRLKNLFKSLPRFFTKSQHYSLSKVAQMYQEILELESFSYLYLDSLGFVKHCLYFFTKVICRLPKGVSIETNYALFFNSTSIERFHVRSVPWNVKDNVI